MVWPLAVAVMIVGLLKVFDRGVKKTINSLGIALIVDRQLKILYASDSAQELLIDEEKSAKLVAVLKEQFASYFTAPQSINGTGLKCTPFRFRGKGSWLIQFDEALFSESSHGDSGNLIHTIIQAIPDAIGMMDHNLVYKACNQAFVEPLGIASPEDLLGKQLKDVASKEIVEKFSPSDRKVLDTGEAFLVVDEFVDDNGEKHWIDARKFRFVDPQTNKPGLFILARDITDVELAKKELNDARDSFQRLSMIDPLTQIGNRRMFNEHLVSEWKSHARNAKPFSLIMCDIDKFKKLNDTYGHVFGDEVLVTVAEALGKPLKRPLDRVYRYGGEEFAFILRDTDSEGAKTVAERVHNVVSSLNIEYESCKIHPPLTVSLGVYTCYPKVDEDPMEAVMLVDEALYRAKDEGRNQTVFVGNWHHKRKKMTEAL
ncbi:GGDEF domain-containing protein [Vibrio hannami]|uniref:sensor domain-containing diguanylate cyclase n=1 Tax=Vibrio hannami TaxID=2717094 RepID=UPI00241092F3|nr:GGDEF domain-containing protein [Vibrio hannami]MDG3088306.1 GGDEF domain-containing protein [Vibrio hannami]